MNIALSQKGVALQLLEFFRHSRVPPRQHQQFKQLWQAGQEFRLHPRVLYCTVVIYLAMLGFLEWCLFGSPVPAKKKAHSRCDSPRFSGLMEGQIARQPITSIFGVKTYWMVVWTISYLSIQLGIIIPTDFHSIIFQRGRSTTNQHI